MKNEKALNIILLINLDEPEKSRPYGSLKSLCEANLSFPLHELRRRDKYPFPFKKSIKGVNYMFVKHNLDTPPNHIRITETILKESGLARYAKGVYSISNLYISVRKDGVHKKYLLYMLNEEGKVTASKYVKYVHKLEAEVKQLANLDIKLLNN